jgi:hypothetical protein
VLPLIKALIDIILLRKGPDSIPRSVLILLMALALWLFAWLAGLALIEWIDETEFLVGLFTAWGGFLTYAIVVAASGHSVRLTQTLTAIIGCGSLLLLAYVTESVLLRPFVGDRLTDMASGLTLLWSIPVEGHIIARAIDRHWYIGILVAIGVFFLQAMVYSRIITPPAATL